MEEIQPNNEQKAPLIFNDKQFIYSLSQLLETLNLMDEKEFKTHTSSKKNEITQWVKFALNEPKLAGLLEEKTEKKEYIEIINAYTNKNTSKPIEADLNNNLNKEEKILKTFNSQKNRFGEKLKSFFSNKKQKENIKNEQTPTNQEQEEDFEIKQPVYIKTGIEGFDELITNGIPQGSSVLLCGGPGTGKTTFSLQILANSALKKEKCLYLSFEEEPSQLRAHMRDYGWDSLKMEKEGYLRIKKMNPFEISRSVEALLAHASGELMIDINELNGILPEDFKPERIVLDSLSAVASAFTGKEEGYRIYIDQLFTIFKNVGATSFLISEIEENTNKYTRTGIEEFLADAVVVFYNFRQKSVRVQAMEIIKIRGVMHQKKIVPFKMFPGKGITIFPKEDAFAD